MLAKDFLFRLHESEKKIDLAKKFIKDRTISFGPKIMYHGTGDGAGYGSDLGSGVYWADSEDYAEVFGDKVVKANVHLSNILLIHGDENAKKSDLDSLATLITGDSLGLTYKNKDAVLAFIKKQGIKGIRRLPSDETENELVDWTNKTAKFLRKKA